MKNIIEKLINKIDLEPIEVSGVFDDIFSGKISEILISAILVLLRSKGEKAHEILEACKQMKNHALKVNIPEGIDIIDTCGTGGDSLKTFNISTTCAFVLAGGGLYVGKHGNRSNTSLSGSSDVLNSLGVKIDMNPNLIGECISKNGIGFLFAPLYHQAMKHVIGVRKELGIRTIFNMLGPLTNPIGAKYQIIGVFSKDLVEIFTEVLNGLSIKSALVVHGSDGMDEITLTGNTYASYLKDGKITNFEINPEEYGFDLCNIEDLKGGTVDDNAEITRGILSGKIKGPMRDIVLLNSAAGFFVSGKALNFCDGIIMAKESINSGNAMNKLNALINFSS